jgi:pyruvate kinase
MRRTKILATLGPASRDAAVLDQMMAAGLDAVRLNFSHGTLEAHGEACARVRAAALRAGRAVAVLQDLQGPKVRIGMVKGQMAVPTGSRLVITTRKLEGENGVVSTEYEALARDVKPGDRILLDEGRISLVVQEVSGSEVITEVRDGGTLSSNKGINVPGAALTVAAMTDKDRTDVAFGLALGVDFVALSFVRRADDIRELRAFMESKGRVVPIIAKIEKPQAVEAIDEIVEVADGVMVARGDLAIEASLEMIPAHQKKIIERANRAGKLVITATQMLESMTDNALPTRAEVTDVANAVLDGTDAVMLSGETAVGKYPVETVRRMSSIAETAEETLYPFERPVRTLSPGAEVGDVLARMAVSGCRDAGARAIVVFTHSWRTAMRLSDERPRVPVLAFSHEDETLRRLALYWGVRPRRIGQVQTPTELLRAAEEILLSEKWAAFGDRVVLVLGSRTTPDAANSVRIARVGE